MTLTQTRVAKGTPQRGGRWAVGERAQTTTALTAATAVDAPPGGVDLERLDISADRMLAVSREAVDYWATRKSAGHAERVVFTDEDAADMAQDAVVSVLHYQKTGSKHATAGWLGQMAHNEVVAAVRGDINPTDAKARRLLDDQVDTRMQDLGRSLSHLEVDELAAGIRARWADPRHMPTAAFQHTMRTRATTTSKVPDRADTLDGTARPDCALGRALTALDTSGGKTQATLLAWEALAGRYDAPSPTRTVKPRQSTALRVAVASSGGVLAAATEWDGGQDTAGTRALFEPFVELDDAGKYAVVNMLQDRSAYAEELWASAARGTRGS